MVERMPIKFASPMHPTEDAALGMIEDMDAGQSGRVAVSLTPGRYMVFCNVTGHYAAGQHTVFRVTSRLASAWAFPSCGLRGGRAQTAPMMMAAKNRIQKPIIPAIHQPEPPPCMDHPPAAGTSTARFIYFTSPAFIEATQAAFGEHL